MNQDTNYIGYELKTLRLFFETRDIPSDKADYFRATITKVLKNASKAVFKLRSNSQTVNYFLSAIFELCSFVVSSTISFSTCNLLLTKTKFLSTLVEIH